MHVRRSLWLYSEEMIAVSEGRRQEEKQDNLLGVITVAWLSLWSLNIRSDSGEAEKAPPLKMPSIPKWEEHVWE